MTRKRKSETLKLPPDKSIVKKKKDKSSKKPRAVNPHTLKIALHGETTRTFELDVKGDQCDVLLKPFLFTVSMNAIGLNMHRQDRFGDFIREAMNKYENVMKRNQTSTTLNVDPADVGAVVFGMTKENWNSVLSDVRKQKYNLKKTTENENDNEREQEEEEEECE